MFFSVVLNLWYTHTQLLRSWPALLKLQSDWWPSLEVRLQWSLYYHRVPSSRVRLLVTSSGPRYGHSPFTSTIRTSVDCCHLQANNWRALRMKALQKLKYKQDLWWAFNNEAYFIFTLLCGCDYPTTSKISIFWYKLHDGRQEGRCSRLEEVVIFEIP